MIDLNSPEFYTIAFVVAMAMLAFFFGHREKRSPSTYIVQLTTTPVEKEDATDQSESSASDSRQNAQLLSDEESEDLLIMEQIGGGRIQVSRTGLALGDEETVNLVITVQEEQCTIIEKKGIKRRRAIPQPVTGEATLKCLRPGTKYRVRYESQLTSAWASFTLDTASPNPINISLKY